MVLEVFFFIESKLFQLVVEEGGNFFSLRIFERGKYYMQSVFMGKSAALWVMRNLEHIVIGVDPKQFFTFREGDTAYTLQRGSNSFGQYLSVTELKVGGLRRTIIIPAGKSQQGWRIFGIELRRMLEPSQYALGGLKLAPYKAKQVPKYRAARSFVEAVKAPVQARPKPVQQPFIKEKVKDGVVKNILDLPSDNTQVVVFEKQAGSLPQAAVGGGEGEEGGINGKTIIKEKISEGNNHNIPFKFNLNSNIVEFGKLHDNRKSRWLGRGLIVEVNEFGKRRVSWESVKGGKLAGKWVARESVNAQIKTGGLDPCIQKTQSILGNTVGLLGTKSSNLGLDWSSPRIMETGESSSSGPSVLESFNQPLVSLTTTTPVMISPLAVTDVAVEGDRLSPTRLAQPPFVPTGPAVVTQASDEPPSAINAPNGSLSEPVLSSAMRISTTVSESTCVDDLVSPRSKAQCSTMPAKSVGVTQASSELVMDPIVSALVPLTSTVATEDGDEYFEGLEGSATTISDSDYEGAQLAGPTIKELFGELDKSWGNSKDWILQLRDGRQLVLPLSLYRSPDCMSVSSSLEGECVPDNVSITDEGQWVSWADEGEGLAESMSVVPGSKSEMWEVDEGFGSCARGDEPLVVVPLATEGPVELVSSQVKEIGCKESVDKCQLSQWVTNRIKAFKKSVGTSLEGFEEQITGLLLAIEARKKEKQKLVVGDWTKLVKSGQKGQRELKNLLSSLNVEYDPNKVRSASSE